MYPHHDPVLVELQMRDRLGAAEQPVLLERLVHRLLESLLKRHISAGAGLREQQQGHRFSPDVGFVEWVAD